MRWPLGRPAAIDEILQTRLSVREDAVGTEWRFWEHKSMMLHRGVLHWRCADRPASVSEIPRRVRKHVGSRYKISWWRGFGFGVLIEFDATPKYLSAVHDWVETRANNEGTWQWAVLASGEAQVALGVHTWTEGYLSPVYRDLLDHYRSIGFTVEGIKKDKDRLMQFLTAVAKLKGIRFDEFEP